MSGPDVKELAKTLSKAKEFVAAIRGQLTALRGEREQLNAEADTIRAAALPWNEHVETVVAMVVDREAVSYEGLLTAWIRDRNPGLAEMRGYESLPFLEVDGDFTMQSDRGVDVGLLLTRGVSAPAACYFWRDELRDKLRALLLSKTPPNPPEQCLPRAERDARLKTITDRQVAITAEIESVEAEIEPVRAALNHQI